MSKTENFCKQELKNTKNLFNSQKFEKIVPKQSLSCIETRNQVSFVKYITKEDQFQDFQKFQKIALKPNFWEIMPKSLFNKTMQGKESKLTSPEFYFQKKFDQKPFRIEIEAWSLHENIENRGEQCKNRVLIKETYLDRRIVS